VNCSDNSGAAAALLMGMALTLLLLAAFEEASSYRGPDEHQYIAVRALPGNPRGERETLLVFALPH
jgi:hypothetical protein